jgi:hypothetical protein
VIERLCANPHPVSDTNSVRTTSAKEMNHFQMPSSRQPARSAYEKTAPISGLSLKNEKIIAIDPCKWIWSAA